MRAPIKTGCDCFTSPALKHKPLRTVACLRKMRRWSNLWICYSLKISCDVVSTSLVWAKFRITFYLMDLTPSETVSDNLYETHQLTLTQTQLFDLLNFIWTIQNLKNLMKSWEITQTTELKVGTTHLTKLYDLWSKHYFWDTVYLKIPFWSYRDRMVCTYQK